MDSGRILWILIFLVNSNYSQTLQNVTAVVGKSCELQCGGPPNEQVKVLRWWRKGKYSPFVFFYRDNLVMEEGQDSSFSNRLKLTDTENPSLVLMNVTFEDRGTYGCLVQTKDNKEEVSNICLMVHLEADEEQAAERHEDHLPTTTPTADTEQRRHWITLSVVLLMFGVTVCVGGCLYFFKCQREHKEKSKNLLEEKSFQT